MKAGAAALVMFGFGYALVPLYDVFCEITGLNGKTGVLSVEHAGRMAVDQERLVTVEFDTNVNSRLDWEFQPAVRRMNVHPGQVYEAVFYVSSRADHNTVGRAVPSVAPAKGSLYFSKTECFCFTEQPLEAGESKSMPVRFVIDPGLPDNVDALTLSYTFFPAPGPDKLHTGRFAAPAGGPRT